MLKKLFSALLLAGCILTANAYEYYIESGKYRMKISETDNGRRLQEQVDDLRLLLLAYRTGAVTEDLKE